MLILVSNRAESASAEPNRKTRLDACPWQPPYLAHGRSECTRLEMTHLQWIRSPRNARKLHHLAVLLLMLVPLPFGLFHAKSTPAQTSLDIILETHVLADAFRHEDAAAWQGHGYILTDFHNYQSEDSASTPSKTTKIGLQDVQKQTFNLSATVLEFFTACTDRRSVSPI